MFFTSKDLNQHRESVQRKNLLSLIGFNTSNSKSVRSISDAHQHSRESIFISRYLPNIQLLSTSSRFCNKEN